MQRIFEKKQKRNFKPQNFKLNFTTLKDAYHNKYTWLKRQLTNSGRSPKKLFRVRSRETKEMYEKKRNETLVIQTFIYPQSWRREAETK